MSKLNVFRSLAVLTAALFLSSSPVEARKRHRHDHRHRHVERLVKHPTVVNRDCVDFGSLNTVRVEYDFTQKEAVKYTETSWQDIYAEANMSFTSLQPMAELPAVVAKPPEPVTSFREKLGAIIFGGIMIFGSVFSIFPIKRKRV